jgi:hypothetical protein
MGVKMLHEDEKKILIDIREKVVRIETHFIDLKDRVKKVEDNQTWLWRTFVGAIIGWIYLLLKAKGIG